jgi:hypothetical protein
MFIKLNFYYILKIRSVSIKNKRIYLYNHDNDYDLRKVSVPPILAAQKLYNSEYRKIKKIRDTDIDAYTSFFLGRNMKNYLFETT